MSVLYLVLSEIHNLLFVVKFTNLLCMSIFNIVSKSNKINQST